MQSDICIVGGGLVGLAAALAFSHQGYKVRLMESMDLRPQEPSRLDARSLALSHSTAQILSSLGLWPALLPNVAPISHIHVSSAGHFGVTRLEARDLGMQSMGYVVEYHVLMGVLMDAVNQNDSVELISPARFVSLQQTKHSVTIRYSAEEEERLLEAALLVVADD